MKRTRRYVIPSDDHEFVGRVFDLIMPLHLGFKSYEQAKEYPDALYALDVGDRVELLTRRVELLNVVGTMLWTRNLPRSFKKFPISRYEWLNAIADIFLMRLISVSDCAALLTNEVFQCGLNPRGCTIIALEKKEIPSPVIDSLRKLSGTHVELRNERNARFHHGLERSFSDDNSTFKTVALFEHRYSGMSGTDRHGRPIDLQKYLRDEIEELRVEFTPAARALYRNLNKLYDLLYDKFDPTFSRMFRARRKPMPWE